MNLVQSHKNIKVCSGAGCRAWASDKIAVELENLEEEGYRVCRVSCMKRCGGGATVQISTPDRILKLKASGEALEFLAPALAVPALT